MNIWYGTNEATILSNLTERPFVYRGVVYNSVEHAYQCLKNGQELDIACYRKPWKNGSKFFGKRANTVNNANVDLMRDLIHLSLDQNPGPRRFLMDTGQEPLTHVQDRGIWKTEFPRILMQIRKELLK